VVPISGAYDMSSNWVINNYANNDPSNFRASGYVDYALNNQDLGIRSHTFGGRDDVGPGADFSTLATVVNYQHFLDTAFGTHSIDVGFQNDKFHNSTLPSRLADFVVPGQLPYSLTTADFYNPSGVPINLADYQGRFIVFNVHAATLGDLDSYGINRFIANNPNTILTPNTRLFDGGTIGATAARVANYLPRVTVRFGEGSPGFYTQMRSFYANDLWTINDHHSVMLGLRFDNWKFWDEIKDRNSYSKITPRFEYKWDIHGDQSRLASFTFAQYHNQNRNQTFGQFYTGPLPNSGVRYWNRSNTAPGANPNAPYLVTYEQFTNLANYGPPYSSSREASDTSQIDPGWKAPTTNELSVTFARNLSNGGSYKLTFVSRVWSDMFDLFPGEPFTNDSGQKQSKMLLKNTDVWERTYTGVELEWHVPISKRLVFAGNYTYGRLMSNESGTSDGTNLIHSSGGSTTFNTYEFWDSFWPREVWAPVTQRQMDHNFKFQLIQDLSLGKIRSTVALQGAWQSAGYGSRTFAQYSGYPTIPGVNEYSYGGAGQNTTNLSAGRSIMINLRTGADSWYTNLRYNLDMPLHRKLVWFMTADMGNPFNHRGKQFSPTGTGVSLAAGNIYLVDLVQLNANGSTSVVAAKGNGYNGVWRSEGNVNGVYRDFMGGRSVTVQTGLRF
jgi:hypothetical protein